MSDQTKDTVPSRVEQLLLVKDGWPHVRRQLAEIGPAAVPHLVEAASRGKVDKKVAERAALALGEFEGPGVLEALQSLLESDEPTVVAAALTSLRNLGDTTCAPAVVALLDREDDMVRKEGLKTLATIGDESCLAPLAELLEKEGEDFLVRLAREAMEKIRHRRT